MVEVKVGKHVPVAVAALAVALALGGCAQSAGQPTGDGAGTPQGSEVSALAAMPIAEEAAGTVGERYVGAEWLKDNIQNVTILDARSASDYATQHIPGAVNLHWTDVSNVAVAQGEAGWAEVSDAAALKAALGRAGIDGQRPVVIYTDPQDGWGEDGRMLWTLQQAGLADVYILDGGWPQWLFNQGSHESQAAADPSTSIAQVDTDYVKEHQSTAKIVDARSSKEYAGEITMGESRTGHIPGAVSLPSVALYNDDATLKSAEEIEALVADAGLTPSDEIIVYCTGGVRAANVAEILSALGYGNVNVYTAGFSEWAGDPANPVE